MIIPEGYSFGNMQEDNKLCLGSYRLSMSHLCGWFWTAPGSGQWCRRREEGEKWVADEGHFGSLISLNCFAVGCALVTLWDWQHFLKPGMAYECVFINVHIKKYTVEYNIHISYSVYPCLPKNATVNVYTKLSAFAAPGKVPTTFREMFLFNAAVMGFGGSTWMDIILDQRMAGVDDMKHLKMVDNKSGWLSYRKFCQEIRACFIWCTYSCKYRCRISVMAKWFWWDWTFKEFKRFCEIKNPIRLWMRGVHGSPQSSKYHFWNPLLGTS